MLAETCEIIDGLALPKHSECSVIGELFVNDVGEDMVELVVFLLRRDIPWYGNVCPRSLLVVFVVGVIIGGLWLFLGVTLPFVATHSWAGVPGFAVIVPDCSMIFVATYHLATVPGVTAVVVTPPWMELIIAFPRVVVDLSLLPESSNLGWSSSISKGGRHGELTGELFGVEGVGGKSGNLDGEFVVFPAGFLCGDPVCVQCSHLEHSVFCIIRCIA